MNTHWYEVEKKLLLQKYENIELICEKPLRRLVRCNTNESILRRPQGRRQAKDRERLYH